MATAPDQKATALFTEHLTYTPITYIDDTINRANGVVYHAASQIENYLTGSQPSDLGFKAPPGEIFETDDEGFEQHDENTMDQINNGMHQFEMLLENGVDRGFDGFELYALRNIFNVPEDIRDWVRLGHHKDLDFSHAITPRSTLPKMVSINALRKQIRDVTAQEAALKAEVARNEAMIKSLKSIVQPASASASDPGSAPHPLSFMFKQTPAMQAVKPVPDSAAFTVQQVQTLKQMTSKLQDSAADLANKRSSEETGDAMDIDKSGSFKGKERDLYVEKMSRRHLERARGLNLTSEGALRSGEAELGGERKNEEEGSLMETLASKISERKSGEN